MESFTFTLGNIYIDHGIMSITHGNSIQDNFAISTVDGKSFGITQVSYESLICILYTRHNSNAPISFNVITFSKINK